MLLSRVVVDSSSRNATRFPSAADFELDLSSLELTDVVELRLVHAALPFPEPHFTAGRDALHVDGGDAPVCLLPRGSYTNAVALCSELSEALRRDMGPGFSAYATRHGRVALSSFTPFTVLTVSPVQASDGRGFPVYPPLPASASAVLGFANRTGGQVALPVGNQFVAVADNTPLSRVDDVAIVRLSDACAVKSDAPSFDRAFAVLHGDTRVADAPPTVHSNDPARSTLRTLRVRLQRRDGSQFDTDGRDVTLHLDVVRVKPCR